MSKQDLIKVVQRSINDAGFRRQLAADAGTALKGYDLTPEELGALRNRDAGKLTTFGVDTRMSKIFTAGGAALGGATVTIDHGAMGSSVQTTGEAATRSSVQTPDSAARNAAIIGDPTLSATSAVQSPDAVDRNAALTTASGSSVKDVEPVFYGGEMAAKAAPLEDSPEASARSVQIGNEGAGSSVRDVEPVFYSGATTGGVQSPDAMDRNAQPLISSGSSVNDVEPIFYDSETGQPLPAHTWSGDENAGPAAEESTGGLTESHGNDEIQP